VGSNIRQSLPTLPSRCAVPRPSADGVRPPPAVACMPAVSPLRSYLHLHGFGAQPPNADEACHFVFLALDDANGEKPGS